MKWLLLLLAGGLPLVPAIAYGYSRRRALSPAHVTRRLVIGLSGVNLLMALLLLGLGMAWFLSPGAVQAAGLMAEGQVTDPYRPLAAAIAVGAGSVGAAYAVGSVGAAAVGAITEKPEVFGRALIFVGLAEGMVIYGLIMAFIILNG